MQKKEQRLMDVKSAAQYLGMSEAALRKRIFLRQFNCLVKIGGRIYLDKKKLDKAIEEFSISEVSI